MTRQARDTLLAAVGYLLDEDHAAGDGWLKVRTGVTAAELEAAAQELANEPAAGVVTEA